MSERSEDVLSDLLAAYQLRSRVLDTPTLCGQWQMSTAGAQRVTFHWFGQGSGWLHTKQHRTPLRLSGGDLVIFPHDDWHMISGTPELHGLEDREVLEGDGPVSTLICGYFDFTTQSRNALLEALPQVLLLTQAQGGEALQKLGELLMGEIRSSGSGQQALLNKLCDALFVLALRHYIDGAEEPQGIIAAIADPRLRKVLHALHEDPQRSWKLEEMAALALMSRTAFAQRFAERVGQTPAQYLTRYRMTLAMRWLQDEFCTVKELAGRLGYETEAAFRRAFKRVHGVGPGKARRKSPSA